MKILKWFLIIFSITGILISGYVFYDPVLGRNIIGTVTGDSCKATGGEWETKTFHSISPGDLPQQTKELRIKWETNPNKPKGGFDAFHTKVVCNCTEGKYWGSYEEGCIPFSERKESVKDRG